MKAFLFLAVVALSLFPFTAFPQGNPMSLDEIVVTASRTESPLKEAPANVTIITADQVSQSGARTVADVLEQEPGVFPQNYLGNPKTANIDIRGYGETAPTNVLVLVNGRRVNSPDLSGADLSQIPVDAIERVEVYRGPATVLYGDNASAGAVNIILKAGQGPPKMTTAVTAGSYNYVKPEATVSGKQGRLSYFAVGSTIDTTGYRHNNAYHAKDLLGTFIFDMNRLTLNLSAGHHRDDYGQPGSLFLSALRAGSVDPKDSTRPDDAASTEDNFFDLVPEIKLHEDVVLSIGGSYRNRHSASYWDFGSGSFSELKSQFQTYGFTPKLVVSTPIADMKSVFVMGLDYYTYSSSVGSSGASFMGPSQSSSDIEKRDLAYYVNERFYPWPDLVLEAGYRKQRTKYDVDFADFSTPVLSQVDSTRYEREACRFSANYSFLENINVFVTYSTGFRFPVADEFVIPGQLLAPGLFIPTQINTDLKPQITEELDIGMRFSPSPRLAGTVTYFKSRTRDEIFFNPLTFANENYDRTERQGVEATLLVGITEGLNLNLAYSYTKALFNGGVFDGNRIPLVPRNKGSARLTYAIGEWRFGLAANYSGPRYAISDQANVRQQLPGYTTFDGNAGYTFKKLSALFTVKNITDKRYEEVGVFSPFSNDTALFPSPGRQFFLRLQYELGG